MLPLLKRYSDDIRAAHFEVMERAPTSLHENMAAIERTFCDKLIGELKGMVSNAAPSDSRLEAKSKTPDATATPPAATSDASAPSAAAASKLIELSEERAAHLACPGLPTLATLKKLDEEDKTIVDEMIDDDWKHRNDAGYCGYANYAHASGRGTFDVDYLVWVIKRGFYVGALDVGLIVRTQTLDNSLRIIQALHERKFQFPMDLPVVCADRGYYSIVEWLYANVEQFREKMEQFREKTAWERAARLAYLKSGLKSGGLPTLLTLQEVDEKDKTILDELIEYDRERSLNNALRDEGYCGYANYAHVSTHGIDYLVWVIERGFYLGALDVCLVVRNETFDHSLRILQALYRRGFEFPMELPLLCVEKEYYSIIKLFNNVEQFRANKDKMLALAIESKNMEAVKYLCTL